MMKRVFLACALLLPILSMVAQVKQPTIMVEPSDVWCTANGYVTEYDNQGIKQILPNYRLALQSDPILVGAITRLGILMKDRGFPLKDLEAVMKSIERNQAENNLMSSKTSGASILENPIDVLRRTARADIILSLTWSVNTLGPQKSVTYSLRGLDAYTGVQIAGAQGTGTQSNSSEVPVLLEEAISVNMERFTEQLQSYFEDLGNYGREVSIDIRVFDNSSGLDLESEFDGTELSEIIDNWMYENTVGHTFNKSNATESHSGYEQVRIPLYRQNGMGMDAEYFLKGLQKYLKAAPYNVTSKVSARGLGHAVLIIGEK